MKVKLKSIAKTVAATGTPEALSPDSIQTSSAIIIANKANTQPVKVGDSTAQLAEIAPGSQLSLSELLDSIGAGEDTVDLKDIWVKVAVNGEGVSVAYTQRANAVP